jgi:hypothetical protein
MLLQEFFQRRECPFALPLTADSPVAAKAALLLRRQYRQQVESDVGRLVVAGIRP